MDADKYGNYHEFSEFLVATKERIRLSCHPIPMPSAGYVLKYMDQRKVKGTLRLILQPDPRGCDGQTKVKSQRSYLLELQFRVDPHVADLTVEGTFLRVGFRGRAPSLLSHHLRTQTWVGFDGPQPTSCLLDGFVFGTL